MKKILTFIAAITLTFAAYAQEGIKWETGTFQQTLNKAKENKQGPNIVFLDCYTTWCGPCKEMFAHVPAFKEKAKDLDVAYLYLSIDRPDAEKAWRKAIPYYQLKGYHLLAGQELAQAVYRELGNEQGAIAIPRFLIVNKEGNIVVPNAASPDQPEKLIEQLKEVLAK